MMLIKPPIRGADKYRSYKSNYRPGKHNGVDYECAPGSVICAVSPGKVTKLGYPYANSDYRYVQVTDADGNHCRYFYVLPSVELDQIINEGDGLGTLQNIGLRYPGITSHVHFEVVVSWEPKTFIDPEEYLRGLG